MIRVLHFIPGYKIGGVESLVLSLYRQIDKSRVQFDFLVETKERLTDFDEIEALGGHVYKIKPLNKKNPLSYIKQLKNFMRETVHNYDCVHCHNIERSAVVLYYAKKYGIECRIFHAHTDSVSDARYERLTKLLIRINNKLSTAFLAASKKAGRFHFSRDNVSFVVLKNAIDSNKFSFSSEIRRSIRSLLRLEKNFVIGHTGRFTFAKNHSKIIDVFSKVYAIQPNAKLLLVGDGPTRKEIEQKASALGLSKMVIFTGARNDVDVLLQGMDVFLLPSFFEGFCISLLEAQSVGLPCVTSDVIPPEVQVTTLVKKLSLNDTDERWANEILSCQNHPRSSQSKQIVQSGYDSLENAKKLLEFYLDHVENRY